jgi:hypothetical protein
MKTILQGQYGDAVLSKMATTFKTLSALADFSGDAGQTGGIVSGSGEGEQVQDEGRGAQGPGIRFGGLVYNINLHLPESRDPAVYDALFRSLREHLS